jgi:hypothetical protein
MRELVKLGGVGETKFRKPHYPDVSPHCGHFIHQKQELIEKIVLILREADHVPQIDYQTIALEILQAIEEAA